MASKTDSLCKGKCQKFIVKKIRGIGRYESGQVRCKVCDAWLDYRGCHKKNGEPAEKNYAGMRCNCCKMQVHQKHKVQTHEDKLQEIIVESNTKSFNLNPCPNCGIRPTDDNVESIFGMREINGKEFRQSYCKNCRKSKISIKDSQDKSTDVSENKKSDTPTKKTI